MTAKFWTLLFATLFAAATLVACGDDSSGTNNDDTENGDTNEDCLPAEIIDATISENTTLGPRDNNCPAYFVDGDIQVGAELTVEPGTIIEFAENSGFVFRGGQLLAEGTEENPILFTGSEKSPGWWLGIFLRDSESLFHRLDHITIEYAGYDNSANLQVGTPNPADVAQTSLRNATFQHGSGAGLILETSASIQAFDNITISDNAGPTLFAFINQIQHLGADSTYTGNGEDLVYVEATGNSATIDEPQTWSFLAEEVPFIINGFFQVQDQITMEAGASFQFTTDSGIQFTEQGSLVAEGTDDSPILLTAQDSTSPWAGLLFSSSRNNTLDHIIVEYGGSTEHNGIAANIHVGETTQADATITNAIIRNSSGYGLYVDSASSVNANACDPDVNEFADNADDDCLIQ